MALALAAAVLAGAATGSVATLYIIRHKAGPFVRKWGDLIPVPRSRALRFLLRR